MNNTHIPHPRTVRFAERACGHDPIQRIIAVVEFGGVARPAVEKAARLAAAFGATLELYACDEVENVPASWAGGSTLAQYLSVVRERRLAVLEERAAPYRASGLSVSTIYECRADPEEALVMHAIRSGASLVVKDVSRAELAPFPSGSADQRLMAGLPMPLLLVRAEPWGSHPRVGASVDPCRTCERPIELDESVVGLGGSIGRALGGVSFAMHVLEEPAHLPGDVVTDGDRKAAFQTQRAQVLALKCLTSLDDREVHFTEKRVPDGIVQLASEAQPSILVMGVAARHRTEAGSGGTAREVLRRTNCDLLVVKPAGFVSPIMIAE